jgi:TolA-binding protein
MKKTLVLLAVIALTSNMCFADKNWFDVELAKIRNVKEAKCRVIDSEIARINTATTMVQTDTTKSSAQRQQELAMLNKQISSLNSQKLSIERQYKADKDTLKSRWKNGNRNSSDIVSKWMNDETIGNILPDESYTYTKQTVTTYPAREYRTTTQTTTQTTKEMIPVKKTTTTTVTTSGRTPVQKIEYRNDYGPKPTVNEKADIFVTPEQKNVDPSQFKVILH